MKILQRLASDDIFRNEEGIYKLFLNFPFKDFQQKVQRLDKNALADFFLQDFITKKRTGSACFFEVVDSGNSLALFVVEPLNGHSKIYDKRMFQISNVVNYLKLEPCFNLFWSELMKTIRYQKIEHLSCRLDASDYKNIAFFTRNGFRYVGISVKAALSLVNFIFLPEYQIADLSVEMASSADLLRVLEISQQHRHNHIAYDVFLDKNKAGQLFSERVRGFYERRGANIYTLKRDNKVLGFASYLEPALFNRAMNKKITTLDLVVIDDKCRGKNFGTYLLAESLISEANFGFEEVELRVASDNYPALNLYNRLGFRIISGDVWLSYEPKQ